jgi:UDP-GlcNAc:undecaprenyl-phosphate/decaprenyl-phosphate GlcNAc-1-phosphate transferase
LSLLSVFQPELIAFPLAWAIAFVCTPVAIRAATSLNLLDSPDGGRRTHASAVPRIGGVAVFAGLLLALLGTWFFQRSYWGTGGATFFLGLSLGVSVMFLIGLLDDIRGLKPSAKILAQVVAALLVWHFEFRPDEVVFAYGYELNLGVLALPLFVIWVVAVTNAFNLIDGLDGLAGGVGVIIALGAAVAAAFNERMAAFVAVAGVAGALLGFLRYNFPRARVFLGDSGSMAVGFVLSIVLLRASATPGGGIVIAIPLFAMAFPFLDTALAITRRWLRNTPIFGADARHIHHRLLASGLSPTKTVVVLWLLTGAATSFGLLLAFAPPAVMWVVAVAGAVAVLVVAAYGSTLLAYHELLVAGQVLLSGPGRARRLIEDQIRAVDLAQRVKATTIMEELEQLLEGSASEFGFLHMALISSDQELPPGLPAVTKQRLWRFEFPVTHGDASPGYTLSVWCEIENKSRPFGAERVCRLLAPELSRWLAAHAARAGESPARLPAVADLLQLEKTPRRRRLSLRD